MSLSSHFRKTHALGNDFVVLDDCDWTSEQIKAIANRKTGIGCDQILVVGSETAPKVRIYNNDGTGANQCLNGLRSLAVIFGRRSIIAPCGLVEIGFSSGSGFLSTKLKSITCEHVEIFPWKLRASKVVVGNNHIIVWDTGLRYPYDRILPQLEGYTANGANVSVAKVVDFGRLELSTWERGAGWTDSCGSACAAAVYGGNDLGYCDSSALVAVKRGVLEVFWQENNLLQKGPVELIADGRLVFGEIFD